MAKRRPFAPVKPATVEWYGPGDEASVWNPGDFILTHGDAWTSKAIRWGQGLRIHGKDRVYTYWNHAAIVVSVAGDIVEALGAGVAQGNVSHYKPTEYQVVRVDASPDDRGHAVAFAAWSVHAPYGFSRSRVSRSRY